MKNEQPDVPSPNSIPWAGVFDLFRIGIGPSSSHTVGPMIAAARFSNDIPFEGPFETLKVELFGSLALTGKGHGTDRAIALGLLGEKPDQIDPDLIPELLFHMASRGSVTIRNHTVPFDPHRDFTFNREMLPRHPNALRFMIAGPNAAFAKTYYSIGGGFVVSDDDDEIGTAQRSIPYPFTTSRELLDMAAANGLSIAALQRENERVFRSDKELSQGIDKIWQAMKDCVERGLRQSGELPGGLRVRRRAPSLHIRLLSRADTEKSDVLLGIDWVNLFALAVNEENAAGGRVVTAPTNGAAGIIPAVLHYYDRFVSGAGRANIEIFFLAATAIGSLIKRNASISGAEVGCQGEVGSACAMAAAGLAAALGGTNAQIENAAEIGLEHNLGLTCDPIGGLVQIPCIERNAVASVKAINAARLALHGDGEHLVSLDHVIRTMRETGRDMLSKYKETSEGGLAVNAIEC